MPPWKRGHSGGHTHLLKVRSVILGRNGTAHSKESRNITVNIAQSSAAPTGNSSYILLNSIPICSAQVPHDLVRGLRDPGLNQSASESYRRAETSETTNSLRTAMDLNIWRYCMLKMILSQVQNRKGTPTRVDLEQTESTWPQYPVALAMEGASLPPTLPQNSASPVPTSGVPTSVPEPQLYGERAPQPPTLRPRTRKTAKILHSAGGKDFAPHPGRPQASRGQFGRVAPNWRRPKIGKKYRFGAFF